MEKLEKVLIALAFSILPKRNISPSRTRTSDFKVLRDNLLP